MKKFLKTGKKALSVFMAVVMVMTAWVFVAPKASAAYTETQIKNDATYSVPSGHEVSANGDSGLYDVIIHVDVPDGGKHYNKNDGSGENVNVTDSNCAGLTVTYAASNGRGSPSSHKFPVEGDYFADDSKTHIFKLTAVGFPTKVYLGKMRLSIPWAVATSGSCEFYYRIFVSAHDKNSYTELASSPHFSARNQFGSSGWRHYDYAYSIPTSEYPYVASTQTVSWDGDANIMIPPQGDKTYPTTTTLVAYANDNYGARFNATYYSLSSAIDGLSVSGAGTSTSVSSGYKLTADSNTTKNPDSNYYIRTVTANWTTKNTSATGTISNATKTIYVDNPRYKVTYDPNDGELGTNYTYVYYNNAINATASTATANSSSSLTAEKFPTEGLRTGYTFNGLWSSRNGGAQASATDKITSNKTLYAHWNINQYTVKFLGGETGTGVIKSQLVNYDTMPTVPTAAEIADFDYDIGDYHFSFNSWNSEIVKVGTSDVTYTATYDSTFVEADYSQVNTQIAIANSNAYIGNPNYEAIYTEASRSALQHAIDAANANRGLGRTSQAVVDQYASDIAYYISKLEGQQYSVVYINGMDNSVLDFQFPYVFGNTIVDEKIGYPGSLPDYYDSTYHYTFSRWRGSANEANISTITDKNLTIIAEFNRAEHNEELINTIPSTCISRGIKVYKCTDCDYTRQETFGEIGTNHDFATEYTIDVEPTCTTLGYKSKHCTRCAATTPSEEIPALGHDYTGVDSVVLVEQGCDHQGATARGCTRCDYVEVTLTDALGHSWKTPEIVNPTCTSSGYTKKTCENCGEVVYSNFVNAINHNFVEATGERIEPTCTGMGRKVSYCSVCEIQNVETIDATGHTFESNETIDIPATCTTQGEKSIHCQNCDYRKSISEVPALGHTWIDADINDGYKVIVPVGCGVRGVETRTCQVCTATENRYTTALAHDYRTVQTSTRNCVTPGFTVVECSNCHDKNTLNYEAPLGHVYDSVVQKGPDCTHGEYIEYTCTRSGCTEATQGHTKIEVITNEAQGHDFDESIAANVSISPAPTCTQPGKKIITCSKDGCSATKEIVLSATGHNMQPGTPVAPDCMTSGYTPYTCANGCGETYNVYDATNPAAGHEWGPWTITTPATDTQDGVMTRVCAKNNSHTETAKVPSGGHTFDTTPTTNVPATCHSTGSQTFKCTAHANCGVEINVTLPKTAHTLASTKNDPTCTATGSVVTRCTVSGCDYETTQTLAKLGHELVKNEEESKASTCVTAGKIVYDCTRCSYSEETALALVPHTYPATGVHTDATCLTGGYTTYTCTVRDCGATKIVLDENSSGTGHNFTAGANTATCESAGTITLSCTCGATQTVDTPALGHDYQITSQRDATCAMPATKTYKCSRCSSTFTAYEGEKSTTHAYSDAWIVDIPATNTSIGLKYRICNVCHEREYAIIPATGAHNFTIEIDKTEATCASAGSITYKCSETHDGTPCTELSTVELPKLEHDPKLEYVAPGCTSDGYARIYCGRANCGAEIEKTTIAATGHAFNERTNTVPATCQTDGSVTFKCANCTATTTETIAKNENAHVYEIGTEIGDTTLATCSTAGTQVYRCSVEGCTSTYTKFVEQPTGIHTADPTKTVTIDANCANGTPGQVIEKCSCGYVTNITVTQAEHSYKTVNVTGNCLEPSYTMQKCENCDIIKEGSLTVSNASGHNYQPDDSQYQAPTNTSKGKIVLVCSNCAGTLEVEVPAGDHQLIEDSVNSIPATCASTGELVFKCDTHINCGVTVSKELPKLPHQIAQKAVDNKTPTCTVGAQVQVYCTECNTPLETITLASHGHSYEKDNAESVTPTCDSLGKAVYKCVNPDCDDLDGTGTITVNLGKLQHSFSYLRTEPATCTRSGYDIVKCENCEQTYTTNIVNALGHQYAASANTATCENPGVITMHCPVCNDTACDYEIPTPALGHNFTFDSVLQNQTCKDAEITRFKCGRDGCDEAYTEITAVPTGNHNWGPWLTIESATATTPGEQKRECLTCHEIETVVINPTDGHSFKENAARYEAPTCTDEGKRYFECETHPDCELNYSLTVAALGHLPRLETKQAKCGEAGYSRIVCDRTSCTCANKIVSSIEIPALNHSYVQIERIEPTCVSAGSVKYKCQNCNNEYTDILPIASENHTFVKTGETAKTCTTPAYAQYQCTGCANVYYLITDASFSHDWEANKTEEKQATCFEDGIMSFRCYECGARDEASREPIAKIDHRYAAFEETILPTCTTAGLKEKICPDCHMTIETEIIEAKGHNFADPNPVVADRTCETAGSTTYRCQNVFDDVQCTETKTVIEAGNLPMNHSWGEWVITTAATDTTPGIKTRYCNNNPTHTETCEIPPVGHTWVKDEIVREASCTENGKTRYICSTCANCAVGGATTIEIEDIEKIPHVFTRDETAANCTTDGSVVISCANCTTVNQTVVIPATGHRYGPAQVTESTCYEEGSVVYRCTKCTDESGTMTVTLQKKPHVYSDTGVYANETDKPTCTEQGTLTYYCVNKDNGCTASITKAEPATGHNYVATVYQPDCENIGYTQHVCNVATCTETTEGHSYYTDVVPALGHDYSRDAGSSTEATCTEPGTDVLVCANDPTHTQSKPVAPLGHHYVASKTQEKDCVNEEITTYTCDRAGCTDATADHSYSVITALPTGHDFPDTWTVKIPATNNTDGEMERACRTCGEIETCVIPKGDHEFDMDNPIVNPATCTTEGSAKYICRNHTDCEVEITVTLPVIPHILNTVVTDATCTQPGNVRTYCTECNTVDINNAIPALGHDWDYSDTSDETVTTPASCEADGVRTLTCQRDDCNVTTTVVIPKTGHNMRYDSTINATCTTDSYLIYVCDNNCGREYLIAGAAKKTGHNPVEINDPLTKAPTCTQDGLRVEECNNPNCNYRVETVVPHTGHNYTTTVTDPTCHSYGYTTKTCTNGGCTWKYLSEFREPTDHSIVKDEVNSVAPTCESKGYDIMMCENAGCDYTYTVIKDALNHEFEEEIKLATCTEGGYTTHRCIKEGCTYSYIDTLVPAKGHTYGEGMVVREATEHQTGVVAYICTVPGCGNTIYDEYVEDATSHNWSIDVQPATCITNGVNTYTCTRNDCEACRRANVEHVTFTKIIPALGHSWNFDDTSDETVTTAPTCTADGERTLICLRDGCNIATTMPIPATGHNYEDHVVQPTCENIGYTEHTCLTCNYEMRDTYTDAIGHELSYSTTQPTCDKSGYTLVSCDRPTCDYKNISEYSIVDPLGHNPVLVDRDDATCTADGTAYYECDRCNGAFHYEVTLPATGHSFNQTTVNATCDTSGYIIHTCAACGFSYNEIVLDPIEHQFGAWIVEKDATNDEDGMMVRTCPLCHLSEHQVIPKIGHEWSEGYYQSDDDKPTCENTGILTHKCIKTDCAACQALGEEYATYQEIVPALGHDVQVTTVDSTCYSTGKITYKCARDNCDYKQFDDVVIPKKAHTWGEAFYNDEADKPTCYESGVLTRLCTNPGCTEGIKLETVSMLAHDMIETDTAATCVSAAYTTYVCRLCGFSYIITKSPAATGHDFTVKVEESAATCEASGYTIYKCANCDETHTVTEPPIGHFWGPWETRVEPKCSKAGIAVSICQNDGDHIKEMTLGATGEHTWVKTTYSPTCTQNGYTIYACSGCGIANRRDFIPSIGHNFGHVEYVDATCTKPGGNLYTCTNVIDGVACGHQYLDIDTQPLGHKMSQYEFIVYPGDANAWAKKRVCERPGCTFSEYETGADGTSAINKYYKVEFINPWATYTYEYPDATPYFAGTKLAATYKEEVLETKFVLKGEATTYKGKKEPIREKDRDYGAYKFLEWEVRPSTGNLENVTSNIKAYAKYKALEVYYNVRFYNDDNMASPLSNELPVKHGSRVDYILGTPTKDPKDHYEYVFKCWSRNLDHIYSDGGISAKYDTRNKQYVLVYHDWDGTRLGSEVIEHHEAARNIPTVPQRTADATYVYEYSGKWAYGSVNGSICDMDHIEVANPTTQTVDIYAVHYQRFKVYSVTIQVFDFDFTLVPNAAVQILDSKGQLAYTGFTNEDGEIRFDVRYDTVYTAQVTDSDGGKVQKTFTVPNSTPIKLQLEDNRNYDSNKKCNCICHSFLGGLWITMMNILYKLFKIKHVCCYDMFATHGDRLAYAN